MRISDWSSDVCSSDLLADRGARELVGLQLARREFAEQLLLPRVGGRLDAVEEDLAEGVAQAAVVLGRIVAVARGEFGGAQRRPHAVLVGGPDAALAAPAAGPRDSPATGHAPQRD